MATKSPIAAIYTDLVNALSGVIETKYIFPGGRPKTAEGSTTMNKFIVIELPVSIEDIAAGNKKFVLNTTGVFYLFIKSKANGTLNVNSTSDFLSSVESLFPIVGDYCGASSPRVLMNGADDFGFQLVTITFDLQTKARIFNSD